MLVEFAPVEPRCVVACALEEVPTLPLGSSFPLRDRDVETLDEAEAEAEAAEDGDNDDDCERCGDDDEAENEEEEECDGGDCVEEEDAVDACLEFDEGEDGDKIDADPAFCRRTSFPLELEAVVAVVAAAGFRYALATLTTLTSRLDMDTLLACARVPSTFLAWP